MSVYAKITNGATVVKEMLVTDIKTVTDWLNDHHGEYDSFTIKYKRVQDIKQGREP